MGRKMEKGLSFISDSPLDVSFHSVLGCIESEQEKVSCRGSELFQLLLTSNLLRS